MLSGFYEFKLKLKNLREKLKFYWDWASKRTCQGAAFLEYILNVDSELRRCGLREKPKSLDIQRKTNLEIFLEWNGMLLTYGDMIKKLRYGRNGF